MKSVFQLGVVCAFLVLSAACLPNFGKLKGGFQGNLLVQKFARDVERTRSVSGLAGCAVTACSSVGQPCNTSSNAYMCVGNTFCNENYVCETLKALGQSCQSGYDSACASGYCDSANYTCAVPQGHNSPGETCSSNNDCDQVGPAPFGTCVNGRCYGILFGGQCNATEDDHKSGCINGYCSNQNSQCTAFKQPGASCAADVECFAGDCSSGTCSPLSSLLRFTPIGQNCSGSYCVNNTCYSYESVCVAGAYCSYDHSCHPNSDITLAACSSDSSCTNSLICTCNHKSGQGQCDTTPFLTEAAYQQSVFDYYTCYVNNNCNTQQYGDCAACQSQTCKIYTLGYDSFQSSLQQIWPPCAVTQLLAASYEEGPIPSYCPRNNESAKLGFGIAIVFVALAIVSI